MSEVKQAGGSFVYAAAGWRRKVGNPLPWGIILLVVIVVVGMHLLALALRPAHLMEMAAEIGSAARFVGRPEATEDGTYVSFSRGTATGGGLFACNLSTGQERLLYEDSGNRRQMQYGWSPDGKLLAFVGLIYEKSALMIYNEQSGQIENPAAPPGPIAEFEWISPTSFVFLKGGATHLVFRKQNAGLMRMDRHVDGTWSSPYYFANEQKQATASGTETPSKYTPIKGLMATSANSVAWTAHNAIWELEFHESAPVLLWEGTDTNEIVSCFYSKQNEAFLLRLQNGSGQYLASYSSARRQFRNLGEIANANVTNVRWINHGKGYAYLLNEPDSHSIFIKANCADDLPIQRFEQDGIREFTIAGDSIYAYGCLGGQPEGVIEYNAKSGTARYVTPNTVEFRFAKNVAPSTGMVTNSLGEMHGYRLWPPVNFNPRNKYPLILSQQRNTWNGNAVAVANAGGFYISIDRPDFNHPQIQHWQEDVMAAYQLMSKNPNIDTNNLYLSGSSDETPFLADLLNEGSSLWKGAIISSPMAFPDLSRIRAAKLLIISGESDEYNDFNKIKQFQRDSARIGIPVTVTALPTGHVFVSTLANKRSTQEFVRFLSE